MLLTIQEIHAHRMFFSSSDSIVGDRSAARRELLGGTWWGDMAVAVLDVLLDVPSLYIPLPFMPCSPFILSITSQFLLKSADKRLF